MEIIVAMLIAFICGCFAYATLNINISRKIPALYKNDDEDVKKMQLSSGFIYILVAFILLSSGITSYSILTYVSDWLNISKTLFMLVIVTGSACFDLREHRIPNIFTGVLFVFGIASLVIGFVISQDGALSYVVSSVFACAGCTLALIVVSFFTKQGIGAGDIKLLAAIAITGGVALICGVMFFSVIYCAICAIFLLVTKKQSRKDLLPFGPFIYLGFITSILLIDY